VHDPLDKNFTLEDRKKQYNAAMDLYKLHERLAMVVDSINDRQKLLKDNMTKVADSTLKRSMLAYNEELEKLRSELLATKQKSAFVDEKRLREDITEVYSGVTGQEAAPSNLQLQRTITLQAEVKKKEEAAKVIIRKYDEAVKAGLKKEGLIGPKPEGKKSF
jgi:protein subunit release factor A